MSILERAIFIHGVGEGWPPDSVQNYWPLMTQLTKVPILFEYHEELNKSKKRWLARALVGLTWLKLFTADASEDVVGWVGDKKAREIISAKLRKCLMAEAELLEGVFAHSLGTVVLLEALQGLPEEDLEQLRKTTEIHIVGSPLHLFTFRLSAMFNDYNIKVLKGFKVHIHAGSRDPIAAFGNSWLAKKVLKYNVRFHLHDTSHDFKEYLQGIINNA